MVEMSPEVQKILDQAEAMTKRYIPISFIKPVHQRWLWRGLLPSRQLTLLVGDKAIGKSLFALWIGSQVTRGRLPGDWDGKPANVVYVTGEDDVEVQVRTRAEAADTDMDRFFVLNPKQEFSVDDIADSEPALIILDPISHFVNLNASNEYAESALRKELAVYRTLAMQKNTAVLGIRHPHKAQTTDGQGSPYDVVLGSRTWADVARMVLFCAADQDRQEEESLKQPGLVFPRGNLAARHPGLRYHLDAVNMVIEDETDAIPFFVMEDDPEVEISLAEALSDAPEPKVAARSVAKTWLTEHLKSGAAPIKRKELELKAKPYGISAATLYRAAKDIHVQMESEGWSRL